MSKIINKFGKKFNNKAIKRTPEWIEKQIQAAQKTAEFFAKKERKKLEFCPMCEHRDFKDYTTIYGFHYVECLRCENIFLKDPIKNTIELYTNEGADSHYSNTYLSDEVFKNRVENIIAPKIDFISEVVNEAGLKEDKLWLDIGSGGGDCLYCAKEKGFKIEGFESDLEAINFSRSKLGESTIKEGFLDIFNPDTNLVKSIQKADVISFFNVLEHLDFPRKTIEFFAKSMKKGAFLVIEIPKHKSLASYANMLSPKRIYRHFIAPFHLNIFSLKALEYAYKPARGGGFELAGKWEYGQGFMDIIHAFKDYDKDDFIYTELSKLSNEIQQILDKNGLADFLMIVLRKI